MQGNHRHEPHPVCSVCGKAKPRRELVYAALLRPAIAERITREVPGWKADAFICRSDLSRFRRLFVEEMIQQERGEISHLEQSVIDSMARQETLASNVEDELESRLTLGQRMSDKVASFGGSWVFIGIFGAVLVVWMLANSLLLARDAFDPYPYILLNLVLSCIAAIQAPIIMMSQRRQESRDRLRSQNDYRVNLKAELEIRHLHDKLDYLVQRQWERLLEIQEIQIELLNEITRGRQPPP